MNHRTTATSWEIVTRDNTGAMVNIDYICPHCGFSTGNFILVGASNVDKLDGPWETDQICEVCDKEVTIECI